MNTEVKIILAPLQGYTDAVYRQVYVRHFTGVDAALAPFISTMGEERLKPSRIREVLPEHNKGLPITPQILGNVAEDFIFLSRHLKEKGHDTVNWNMGCPHSKIVRKKRGSGMLPWPEMVDRLLDEVMSAGVCRLTLKVRLGLKDKGDIQRLLPVLDRYPLAEIIVHPRTGDQMYTGGVDLDAFEAVTRKTRHRLVYNGDITTPEVFRSIRRRFPDIDTVMIGRGILADPFLPARIKGAVCPQGAEAAERILAFHDDLMGAYASVFQGPGHLIGRMKGFWRYLGPSFENSRKGLKPVFKSTSIIAYKTAVERFFDSDRIFNP